MKGRLSTRNLLGSILMVPLMLAGGTAFVVVAVHAYRESADGKDEARALAQLPPQTLAEIGALPSGRRVLVTGRVDPRATIAEPERRLVLYVRQHYRHRSSMDDDQPSGWLDAESVLPPFRLRDDGASGAVLNSHYEMLEPPYREPERQGPPSRYRGFRPGDTVLVHGVADRGGIVARAVSGQAREAYIEQRRADAEEGTFVSIAFGVAGVLVFAGGLLLARYVWRRQLTVGP